MVGNLNGFSFLVRLFQNSLFRFKCMKFKLSVFNITKKHCDFHVPVNGETNVDDMAAEITKKNRHQKASITF
jgi:hypothetical protein